MGWMTPRPRAAIAVLDQIPSLPSTTEPSAVLPAAMACPSGERAKSTKARARSGFGALRGISIERVRTST